MAGTRLLAIAAAASFVAAALPRTITSGELIAFCKSATVAEAAEKAGRLGWQVLSDAKLDAWRTSFLAYQGGTVDVVGWRRGEDDGVGLLSFWIARGPNGHRACTYSTRDATDLREALAAELGPPTISDTADVAVVDYWKSGKNEVSFSKVGSAVYVNISRSD